MSLHEFLREGGEVSVRIMNRLSHLIQNLDISGSPFPFSPSSRKNSWKDWDGKRVGASANAMFVLLCNFSGASMTPAFVRVCELEGSAPRVSPLPAGLLLSSSVCKSA